VQGFFKVNESLILFHAGRRVFLLRHTGKKAILALDELAFVNDHVSGPLNPEVGNGRPGARGELHIFDVHQSLPKAAMSAIIRARIPRE